MLKFKEGDMVRILPDFDRRRFRFDPGITPGMLKFAGLTFTVRKGWNSSFKGRNLYKLNETSFTWAEEWLEFDKGITIDENDINNLFEEVCDVQI